MEKLKMEEFAKLLIQHVRDQTIRSCDENLSPSSSNVIARRWRQLKQKDCEEFGRALISDVVDQTIFYLLNSIDQGILELSFHSSHGDIVHLSQNSYDELAGSYLLAEDGWVSQYSQQRYFDYFKDIEL